jgi:hypothetical protein
MISHAIANILLHVILISSFLVVFFFTYASRVEREIVENQSKTIVTDIMKEITVFVPSEAMPDIKEGVRTIQSPDMKAQDDQVKAANAALFKKTLTQISVVVIVGMLCVFIMSKVFKFSMSELLVHNLIILVFVAITEFVFLTYFAKNYRTIDSNYIKYTALKAIENRL